MRVIAKGLKSDKRFPVGVGFQGGLSVLPSVDEMSRGELASLLEAMRGDEKGHLERLYAILSGREAHRTGVANGAGFI